jgi:hydrogenase maturation protease
MDLHIGGQDMDDPASNSQHPIPSTLILGLGNPILTDDGVGIHVVRAAARNGAIKGVTFAEASVGGLRLLDLLSSYERVILVDAIQTSDGQPGAIYRLGPGDLRASLHAGTSHDLSLPATLALGRRLGMKVPRDDGLIIVAVEVEDALCFGETCTPAVARAIPRAVDATLAAAKEAGMA